MAAVHAAGAVAESALRPSSRPVGAGLPAVRADDLHVRHTRSLAPAPGSPYGCIRCTMDAPVSDPVSILPAADAAAAPGCAFRVPFDGASIADLKAKVTSGQFRPVAPGRYSSDLVGLMTSLLSLNPARRPTLVHIFGLPQSQERLAALPASQLSILPPEVMKTIQVREELCVTHIIWRRTSLVRCLNHSDAQIRAARMTGCLVRLLEPSLCARVYPAAKALDSAQLERSQQVRASPRLSRCRCHQDRARVMLRLGCAFEDFA